MKLTVRLLKLLTIFPMVIGTIGFVALAGQPFLDSVFNCLIMYVMNYSDTPPNVLVEIARWTAPLATAGGIVILFSSLHEQMRNLWRYFCGGSVAVYGPENDKDIILRQLGKHGINGQDKFVKAEKYILLGNEPDNFKFYCDNKDKLAGKKVYVRCSSLPVQSLSSPDLKLFCPEEIAARLFWRKYDVYSLWKNSDGILKIVMIGFGKLGEELLLSGLQSNLFACGQKIEYHIFGDCSAFIATHTSLYKISDPVIPHDRPWYENIELMENADMVIVLQQQEQSGLIQKLLSTTLRKLVYVFSGEGPELELLDHRERLELFPWQAEASKLKLLLEDTLYLRAKRINLRYAHIYNGTEEDPENMEKEWNSLDTFTRYSNISAADYHEIRLKILEAEGIGDDPKKFSVETMERLAELEHIRWCRYHYLNNWSYGKPENGKSKDPKRRIHTLLCDYSELSEEEKEKDRENIRILLSIK